MADPSAPELRSSKPAADVARVDAQDVPRTLRGWPRVLLVLLHLLPKNWLSRQAGRLAALRLPGALQQAEIRLFARLAGVDLSEARDPLESFESLQRFFTRALREGARPIEGGALDLVSPCDGAWGAAGRIEAGTLVQVKGRTYGVADLLGDPVRAESYEGGSFATFYLSPRDYHRFHTPTSGRITTLDYLPGALWPVNVIGLEGIDGLFARNERICAYLEVEALDARSQPAASDAKRDLDEVAEAAIAMVAVGATMVGSVRLRFDALRTNLAGGSRIRRDLGDSALRFERGEEWGHFEFGSTIVMLVPPSLGELAPKPLGTPLRLGEVIGRRTA